jgi:hypothetical protein
MVSTYKLINQPVVQWRSFACGPASHAERVSDNVHCLKAALLPALSQSSRVCCPSRMLSRKAMLLCHEAIVFGVLAVCFVAHQSALS